MRCSFFFVSSRRRHTRLQGDWSSDVCSSDLSTKRTRRVKLRAILAAPHRRARLFPFLPASNSLLLPERSEERRVGEESRSRWAPDHLKKKKTKHLLTG